MEKKFELISESKTIVLSDGSERTVYRIKALRDFADVKAGQLGGWVEKETNLSQAGNCFIYDDAVVCDDAVVVEAAVVKDQAVVKDNARVEEYAVARHHAMVRDFAVVRNYALVEDEALIAGNAIIEERAVVKDCTFVEGNAVVAGYVIIMDDVVVCDDAVVKGKARIEGNTKISGNLTNNQDVDIKKRIGERISKLRKDNGLSTRQLADLSGVNYTNIGKLERGDYNISIDILYKICDPLGVEIMLESKLN